MIKKLLTILLLCSGEAFADIEQMMATVPNTLTVVTTKTTYVQLIVCSATSTSTLLITDTAGNVYFPTIAVTANQATVLFTAYGFGGTSGLKMVGIKWQAGGANVVNCQLQGYQP